MKELSVENYIKLLTQKDIVEILNAGEVSLIPPRTNHRGEVVPSYQVGDKHILCRGKVEKTKEECIVIALAPFLRIFEDAFDEILVFISDYTVWIGDIRENNRDEQLTNMILKLKEILSAKCTDYEKDFEEFWSKYDENE